jgi:hypothetical protein
MYRRRRLWLLIKKETRTLIIFSYRTTPDCHRTLIHSIYATDVCALPFVDLSDIYKKVPDIMKRCHAEHMTDINVDLDHAERFEEENKNFVSTLLDDTLIAVVSQLQKRVELTNTELAVM